MSLSAGCDSKKVRAGEWLVMGRDEAVKRSEAVVEDSSLIRGSGNELVRIPLGWTSRDWLSYWTRCDDDHAKSHHLHFWAPADPLDNATLIIHPLRKNAGITGSLRFHNSNGTLVNECTIATRPGQVAQLPLSAFLDGCETDQGFRHAHLELVTSAECHGEIQFSSRLRTSFFTPAHRLSEREPRAVPLSLSDTSRHVLALVNPHDVQCSVKCRLFVGTRSPEEVCLLPPHGTVLISPEVLFASVIEAATTGSTKGSSRRSERGEAGVQAYLKLATRSGKWLGYQILEERSFGQDGSVYGVLS